MDSVDLVQSRIETTKFDVFDYTILVYGYDGEIKESPYRGTASQRSGLEICSPIRRHAAGYIDRGGKVQVVGSDDTLKNELRARLNKKH